MNLSTERIARSSASHPWRTVLIWAAATVVAVVLIGTLFSSATTTDSDFTFEPPSKKALRLLEDWRGPVQIREVAVIRSDSLTVDDPAYKAHVEGFTDALVRLGPEVIRFEDERPQITNYYMTGIEAFVSTDRRTTVMPFTMAGDFDQANESIEDVLDAAVEAERTSGVETILAGPASISTDFRKAALDRSGEMIGIGAAIIILLFVFRAAGAAWIPIVMAVVSIILAVAAASVIGQFFKLSFFVATMISMIGLAVGIDYSLFTIARYREERAGGREKIDAIARSGATATRAVLFSGLTVVFALLGMVIVPTTVFLSLGLGAILVVIIAVLASMTLLPAILSLMGDRVDALKIPFIGGTTRPVDDVGSGFWVTVTHIVMRNPWPALIIVGGLLIAATIPYFQINTGSSGISTLPDTFRAKRAFEILEADFPGMLGGVSFADIVIEGAADSPEVRAGIERLRESLDGDPVFGATAYEASEAGDVGLLSAVMTIDGFSGEATDAVRNLRENLIPDANIPASVYVGGGTAQNLDFVELADRWTPIVIVFVLSLSFVLLTVVFRSLVVPIKAIILNLLSVGAAYGLLVLVIQKGFLIDLFGFKQVESIEAWLPVFLFSILFGLSMDYEVFLLSRIRERYDQTGMNTDSVAFGLRTTAGLITGAALIMVAVFGGFAMGELTMFQQMGFGLGVAILVDATIIRSILVPATMKLLGDWNWYLPGFLSWLPDVRVEVTEIRPAPAGAQENEKS